MWITSVRMSFHFPQRTICGGEENFSRAKDAGRIRQGADGLWYRQQNTIAVNDTFSRSEESSRHGESCDTLFTANVSAIDMQMSDIEQALASGSSGQVLLR
jgi:hypothetical protein